MTIITTESLPLSKRRDIIYAGSNFTTDNIGLADLDNLLNISDDLAAVFVPYEIELLNAYTVNYGSRTYVVNRVKDNERINHIQQLSNELCIVMILIANIGESIGFENILVHKQLYENIISAYNHSLETQRKTTIHEIGGLKRKQEGTFD